MPPRRRSTAAAPAAPDLVRVAWLPSCRPAPRSWRCRPRPGEGDGGGVAVARRRAAPAGTRRRPVRAARRRGGQGRRGRDRRRCPASGPRERVLLVGTGQRHARRPAQGRRRARPAGQGRAPRWPSTCAGCGCRRRRVRALAEAAALASYGFSRKAEPSRSAGCATSCSSVADPEACSRTSTAALVDRRGPPRWRATWSTPPRSARRRPGWPSGATPLLAGLDVRVRDEAELAAERLRRAWSASGRARPARRGWSRRATTAAAPARRARRQGHHLRHRRPVAQAERRAC